MNNLKAIEEARSEEDQQAYDFLDDAAWKDYQAIVQPAWAIYQAIVKLARQAYEAIEKPAYEAAQGRMLRQESPLDQQEQR